MLAFVCLVHNTVKACRDCCVYGNQWHKENVKYVIVSPLHPPLLPTLPDSVACFNTL